MTVAVPAATGASDTTREPGGSGGFRRDIQGLRAIAVTMVVLYHLFPSALPGGFAGVDVFFVISGYLITGQLWRGYERTGTVDLADFWGRRARRLVPAAALVLTATWKLVTELHSSCPWTSALLLNWNGVGDLTGCQRWGAAVLHDLLTTIRPDVVITSDYPSLLSTPDHPVNASPAAMSEIGAGMARYWTQLEEAGIAVAPIRETPDLVNDVPTCVEEHAADLARCDVPVRAAIGPDSPVTDAARLMRGKVTVVDANSLICGPAVCAPVVGNILVYADRHHLTWAYSQSVAPFLEPLLLKANPVLARR